LAGIYWTGNYWLREGIIRDLFGVKPFLGGLDFFQKNSWLDYRFKGFNFLGFKGFLGLNGINLWVFNRV